MVAFPFHIIFVPNFKLASFQYIYIYIYISVCIIPPKKTYQVNLTTHMSIYSLC